MRYISYGVNQWGNSWPSLPIIFCLEIGSRICTNTTTFYLTCDNLYQIHGLIKKSLKIPKE
jgi:hypothetical protein